jgi:hypothetical protein
MTIVFAPQLQTAKFDPNGAGFGKVIVVLRRLASAKRLTGATEKARSRRPIGWRWDGVKPNVCSRKR